MKEKFIGIVVEIIITVLFTACGCNADDIEKETSAASISETEQEYSLDLSKLHKYKNSLNVYTIKTMSVNENGMSEEGDYYGLFDKDKLLFYNYAYDDSEQLYDMELSLWDIQTGEWIKKNVCKGSVFCDTGKDIVMLDDENDKISIYDSELNLTEKYQNKFDINGNIFCGETVFPVYISDYENNAYYKIIEKNGELIREKINLPGYANYISGVSRDGRVIYAEHVEEKHFTREKYCWNTEEGKQENISETDYVKWANDNIDILGIEIEQVEQIEGSYFYVIKAYDEEYKCNILLWDASETVKNGILPKEEVDDTDKSEDHIDALPGKMSELSALYNKAKQIGDKYNVNIYIGDQVPAHIGGYDNEQNTEYEAIDKALDEIDRIFSIYPQNFFEQLLLGNQKTFDIFLCGELFSSEEGTLDFAAGYVNCGNTQLIMSLSVLFVDEYSAIINHELFHAIDARLSEFSIYDTTSPYSDEKWKEMNPAGFEYFKNYDAYDDSLTEDLYWQYEDYFMREYSLINTKEDRADIFGYAMEYILEDYKEYTFWVTKENNENIKKKLDYLCKCIRASFDTTGWPDVLPWEKF